MLKEQLKEQHNPFDDIFFWLQLACIDFSFGFEETSEEGNTKNETHVKIEKGGE